MNPERWMPVIGYEGHYEVSDHGRVRNVGDGWRNGRVLTANLRNGYPCVCLCVGQEREYRTVHRLVVATFLGEPAPIPCPCVNHKDGDRKNNHLENLEWTTYSGNRRHALDVLGAKKPQWPVWRGENHHKAKLNRGQVRIMRHAASLGVSQSFIGSCFGVKQAQVSAVVLGRQWKEVPMVGGPHGA